MYRAADAPDGPVVDRFDHNDHATANTEHESLALLIHSCVTGRRVLSLPGCARPAADADKPGQADVSAVEDLMREHGVLRRLLVVYRETAGVVRASAATLDIAALGQAADLFRSFGEDYHEKALEEAHIFPMVK